MIKKFLLVILALFSINLSALSVEKLNFNGFIADNAQIISEANETELNSLLYALQQETKADIVVVTLNSLENQAIEDISLEIGREYKIGSKNLNNGAVILVAPYDRQARIEIGYGLEGAITDAHAGRIIDDYMIPYFRENNYEKGIIDGTTALAADIADYYGVQMLVSKPLPPAQEEASDPAVLIFIIILLLYINLSSNGRYGGLYFGNFNGSNNSGNFFRFGGGGGFGGGGSSRRW